MAKWKNKPSEVDACTVSDIISAIKTGWTNAPAWVQSCFDNGDLLISSKQITVKTPDGNFTAEWTDYIVHDDSGNLSTFTQADFATNFDEVPNG